MSGCFGERAANSTLQSQMRDDGGWDLACLKMYILTFLKLWTINYKVKENNWTPEKVSCVFFFQISWILSKHLFFSILVCLSSLLTLLCLGIITQAATPAHLPTCCTTSTLCFLLRVLSYVILCPVRLTLETNRWMLITAPWIYHIFPGPLQNSMFINPV